MCPLFLFSLWFTLLSRAHRTRARLLFFSELKSRKKVEEEFVCEFVDFTVSCVYCECGSNFVVVFFAFYRPLTKHISGGGVKMKSE